MSSRNPEVSQPLGPSMQDLAEQPAILQSGQDSGHAEGSPFWRQSLQESSAVRMTRMKQGFVTLDVVRSTSGSSGDGCFENQGTLSQLDVEVDSGFSEDY